MPHCIKAGAAIMAAMMYWAVVGMPMPRMKQAMAVFTSVKKRVMSLTVVNPKNRGLRNSAMLWATAMTAVANLRPIPVRVVAPTMNPTQAQAAPMEMAFFVPSSRLERICGMRILLSL